MHSNISRKIRDIETDLKTNLLARIQLTVYMTCFFLQKQHGPTFQKGIVISIKEQYEV